MKTHRYDSHRVGRFMVSRRTHTYTDHHPELRPRVHVLTFGMSFTLELCDAELETLRDMLEEMMYHDEEGDAEKEGGPR